MPEMNDVRLMARMLEQTSVYKDMFSAITLFRSCSFEAALETEGGRRRKGSATSTPVIRAQWREHC